MTRSCGEPIGQENLLLYWAGDLDADAVERLDEHLIGCAVCSAESARVSAITEAIRAMIPPVVDHAGLAALRVRGLVITDNVVLPDERRPIVFGAETDILMHRLRLDLSTAERVSVRITVEETGAVLFTADAVPFDRESGELLVACQRHFAALPPNIVLEVFTHHASRAAESARYPIPHVYERRAR